MKAILSALLLAVLCTAGVAQARGGPHGGGPGGGGHGMGFGGGHGPGGHFGGGGPRGHFGPGPGPRHWGGGWRGGWGPGFYDDWDFLWLAGTTAYLYDAPYYSYPAAPAVVYAPDYPSEPEPATPIAAAPRFRYYCPGRGYYPQVQTCETDFVRKPIP